jgi:MIP family channel proteins
MHDEVTMAAMDRRAAATREAAEAKTPAAYAAEAIGTFILVFAICGAVSAAAAGGLELNLAGLGLVHAIALAVGVYTLGGTSGGHFNPAVTAGLLSVGEIRARDAGIYVVCQCIGALLAGLAVLVLFHDAGDTVNYAAPAINDQVINGGSPLLGVLAEAIGTAILMWTVMGMAVNPRAETPFAPLIIGLSLGVAAIIFANATSASLNPARWLGPSVVAGHFDDFWVYIVGPVIGAVAAAVGYRALVLEPRGLPGTRPVDVLEQTEERQAR